METLGGVMRMAVVSEMVCKKLLLTAPIFGFCLGME